jgi:hypothetical protein
MGDAYRGDGKEHILVLSPFPRDDRILNSIIKKHPNVTFDYKVVTFKKGKALDVKTVPDGISVSSVSHSINTNIPLEWWEHATILVTLSSLPVDVKLAKNLKLIHLFSAGTDRLAETPIWKDTDIPITNSSGVHGPQISEWVILQILANSHKEKLLLEWQKKHYWGKHEELGVIRDSVKQRLGVLGYGAIGRQSKLKSTSLAEILGADMISCCHRQSFGTGCHCLHCGTS